MQRVNLLVSVEQVCKRRNCDEKTQRNEDCDRVAGATRCQRREQHQYRTEKSCRTPNRRRRLHTYQIIRRKVCGANQCRPAPNLEGEKKLLDDPVRFPKLMTLSQVVAQASIPLRSPKTPRATKSGAIPIQVNRAVVSGGQTSLVGMRKVAHPYVQVCKPSRLPSGSDEIALITFQDRDREGLRPTPSEIHVYRAGAFADR